MMIIDMKRDLINVLFIIYSNINHLLCLWHINKNVLTNFKKEFVTKEAWDVFFKIWNAVIYFASSQNYNIVWDQIRDTYFLSHEECIDYLRDTYISFKRWFVKYLID
jgi:hypothetical protein